MNESGLAINTAEGPTKDVRVRQALSVGTDRKAVIDTVLFGYGEIETKIPCGEVPYGWCEGKDPPLPYYKYDPDLAKKLLTEAGYPKGLDLTMQVSLPLDVQTAEVLADQWKKIGVNLKIEQIADFNQQLDNYINVRDQFSIVSLVLAARSAFGRLSNILFNVENKSRQVRGPETRFAIEPERRNSIFKSGSRFTKTCRCS